MQWTFLEGKGHSRREAMSSTHTILFEFGWKLFKAIYTTTHIWTQIGLLVYWKSLNKKSSFSGWEFYKVDLKRNSFLITFQALAFHPCPSLCEQLDLSGRRKAGEMTGRGIHGQRQQELDACPSPRPRVCRTILRSWGWTRSELPASVCNNSLAQMTKDTPGKTGKIPPHWHAGPYIPDDLKPQPHCQQHRHH